MTETRAVSRTAANLPIIVSERAAAAALSLSPSQLRKMRTEGKAPPAIWLSDRRLGYRWRDLLAWADAQPAA
jgi:hypothetical protein